MAGSYERSLHTKAGEVKLQVGIEGIELVVQCPERLIDHSPDGAQRMILRHPLLRAHRAEQGILLDVWASHLQCHRFHTFRWILRNPGSFSTAANKALSI